VFEFEVRLQFEIVVLKLVEMLKYMKQNFCVLLQDDGMVTIGELLHPRNHSLNPESLQKRIVKIKHAQNQLAKGPKITFVFAFKLEHFFDYKLQMVLDGLVILLIINSHIVFF